MDWMSDLPIIGDFLDIGKVIGIGAAMVVDTADYEVIRGAMHWTAAEGAASDTRSAMLAAASQTQVSFDDAGNVLSGQWTDPVTGYTSTNPADFDIDHRVPFSHVADTMPGFADMSVEEQLAAFNDKDNLQVLHDAHNASKGDALPAEYATRIDDSVARNRFLDRAQAYADKVGIPLAKL